MTVRDLDLDRETLEEAVVDSLLLAGLTDAARADVIEHLEPVLLPGGEVLTREGDEADALYLVVGGRLQVSVDRDGEQLLVGFIGRSATPNCSGSTPRRSPRSWPSIPRLSAPSAARSSPATSARSRRPSWTRR
jgi:hypothetical protein